MADRTARELDTGDDGTGDPDALRATWSRRYAPQLRLDPSSALDRLLVAHLDGPLAAIPPSSLVPPVAASTRRAYEGYIAHFERWCVHTGLVDDTDAVVELPNQVLRRALEQWIAGRLRTDATDPTDPPGDKHRGADSLRAAIRWWALTHNLGDVLTNQARMLTGAPARVRPARAPSDAELSAIVNALVANEVVTALTETITAAWHARQLAAINIALAGSLRPTSEFVLLRDENITHADDDVLVVHLPRTKAHPTGRTVHLHRREDALCPHAALARFLQLCDAAGWDRGGFLLPAVYRRRYQPLGVPTAGAALADPFRVITEHLGITDDLDTHLRATPHGLRAVTPTKAFAAGLDIHTVMRLTGHTSTKSVLVYDRDTTASDAFVSDMAADLDAGSH